MINSYLSWPEPTVLQTGTAQAGLCSVTCGDACGLDRRLRHIPGMSHAARIGLRALDYQLGNLYRPGLSDGLTCGTGCPRVTVRGRLSPGLMARRTAARPGLMAVPWSPPSSSIAAILGPGSPGQGSRSDRVRPGLDTVGSAETIEQRGGRHDSGFADRIVHRWVMSHTTCVLGRLRWLC